MIDFYDLPVNEPENNKKGKNKKEVLPLEEYILRIYMQDDDRARAERAFDVLVDRYEPYLRNAGYRMLFKYRPYDEAELSLLVYNTLFILFKKADHLLHIEKLKTEGEKEALVRAWLGRVASREAIIMNDAQADYHKKIKLKDFDESNKEPGVDDDFEDEPLMEKLGIKTYDDEGEWQSIEEINIRFDDDEEKGPTSEEMIILTEVLNECTAREQEIILTYYEFLDGRKHLPREEIQRLCKQFDILPDYLNHIKHYTFKKIKQKSLERMRIKYPDYRLRE